MILQGVGVNPRRQDSDTWLRMNKPSSQNLIDANGSPLRDLGVIHDHPEPAQGW